MWGISGGWGGGVQETGVGEGELGRRNKREGGGGGGGGVRDGFSGS